MFNKTVDDQQMYYEVLGNKKSDQYVIFLNGISQSTVVWNLMVPAFEKEYQIILCDFIFQGQSDKQGSVRDFDQHAADVLGLMEALTIKKITLIGISYGSLVAQHFAVNYPERVDKLVLLSTFAHKTAYYNAIELAWERTLSSGGYALMLDVMLPTIFSENYFEHPLIPMDTLKGLRQTINNDPEPLQKLMKATKERADYREKLATIKSPTLVIHGEKDLLLLEHMGKTVADSIPKSKFEVIKNAGHTLNLEAVDEVVKLIKAFI
jgi:3-oxoadipate enol-lactonase